LNKEEEEEHLREMSGLYDYEIPELSQAMREVMEMAKKIREQKIIMKEGTRIIKASTIPIISRTKIRNRSVQLKEQMGSLGVDMTDTQNVSIIWSINR